MVRASLPPAIYSLVCQGIPVLLRQAAQILKKVPIIDGSAVHIGDYRPLAWGTYSARLLYPWQIGSGRGFQHQRHLRRHREGSPKGSTGAYFLLSSEGKGHIQGQILLQQLQHNRTANPVINALAFKKPCPNSGVANKGAVGARRDQLLCLFPILRSDIDIEGVGLWDLLLLLPAHQVDGL